ncbi:Ig-like domain repeat protein [Rhodococcus kronopolitis]|uniref:Ig-like domain repeat protein n=1 Tax=Rhodococcus kronopolitis TaxID=1460226 RepID=A0ABV9FNL4_9NOCA
MNALTRRQMFKAMAVTAGAMTLGTGTRVAGASPGTEIRVLSFNICLDGTTMFGGLRQVAEIITATRANVVLLAESKNATKSLATALTKVGTKFHAASAADTGILSQFPISKTAHFDWMNKAVITVGNTEVATYAAHLNYEYYATYLPRGYGPGAESGEFSQFGWTKMPGGPVTDGATVQRVNVSSGRPQAITNFINDAAREQAKGRSIILGGDFNEPSHLDWTDATKDLFDHNGVVIPWETTRRLEQAGFVDAYRSRYPNPVTHPGFTWPSDNPAKSLSQLTWAPDADERDRIDFVFTDGASKLQLTEVGIVGPLETVVRNQRVAETGQDNFIASPTPWPTDHKTVLAVYRVDAANTVTTTATTAPRGAFVGQHVNLCATVSPAVQGGTVEFTVDDADTVTGALGTDGVAVTPYAFTAAGTHSIVARYSGTTGADASVAPAFRVDVTVAPPTDEQTITALEPVGTVGKGAPVTLRARIDPAGADGAVQFALGATPLGDPATVSGGVATLTTAFTTSGTFSVTAEFIAAAGFVGSASAPQTLTVPFDTDPGNPVGGSLGGLENLFGS